ncbi:MAG: hypothetical protein ACI4M6_01280 [Christensenellaceae bacterium]
MLKALIKIQFLGFLNMFFRKNKSPKNNKIWGMAAIFVIIYGLIAFYSFSFFNSIIRGLTGTENYWVCFALYFLFSFLLMTVGNLFMTKSILIEAKDNDLLLSLPIPAKYILVSRLSVLLAFNCYYGLAVGLPVVVCYVISGSPTAAGLAALIISLIVLPVFSLALTSVFAYAISIASRKLKHKSAVSIILSLAFLGAYLALCFKIGRFTDVVNNNSRLIADALSKFLPLKWFGQSVAQPNILYTLAFNAVFLLFSALVAFAISKTFVKTATMKISRTRTRYKSDRIKSHSVGYALFAREFKHLISSTTYFMNCCIGSILTLALSVFVFIQSFIPQGMLNSLISGLASEVGFDVTPLLSAFAIAISVTMLNLSLITPPSVSIEGKSLAILKSLPVKPIQIFRAKILTQLVITILPTLTLSCACAVLIKPSVPSGVLLFLTPLIYAVFIAVSGLIEGIRHPVLDWTVEAVAVKTGFAVVFTMLLGLVAVIPLFLFGFLSFMLMKDPNGGVAVYTVLLALVTLFTINYLKKGGSLLFNKL